MPYCNQHTEIWKYLVSQSALILDHCDKYPPETPYLIIGANKYTPEQVTKCFHLVLDPYTRLEFKTNDVQKLAEEKIPIREISQMIGVSMATARRYSRKNGIPERRNVPVRPLVIERLSHKRWEVAQKFGITERAVSAVIIRFCKALEEKLLSLSTP